MSTSALTTPNDVCRAGCDLALRRVAQNAGMTVAVSFVPAAGFGAAPGSYVLET